MTGHTYERAAIERWLSDHQTSPLTNTPLDSKVLVPNLRLKAIADEAQRERPSENVLTDRADAAQSVSRAQAVPATARACVYACF